MEKLTNQLIIFSKNRACQLHLLFDSSKRTVGLLFDKISVIYKAENEYKDGYEKLKLAYPSINYIEEVDFRNDLLKVIDDSIDATTFMVDDAVVFRPVLTRKVDIIKMLSDDTVCFSLRLGLNCNYSHPANMNYSLGEHTINGEFVIFDYKKQTGDFAYPLSTDGHIFKTSLIKDLLINTSFSNPNTLEANLQQHTINGRIPTKMICFNESKLVSIPANLVNNTFKNRHGLEHYFSEKELNDKYLNNEIIDLEAMDFSNVNGPHKEIEYKFTTKS